MANGVNGRADRPVITSFDSGYEHGLEHLIFVRQLVDEAVEDIRDPEIYSDTQAMAS